MKYLKLFNQINELHQDTYLSAADKITKQRGNNDPVANDLKQWANKKSDKRRAYDKEILQWRKSYRKLLKVNPDLKNHIENWASLKKYFYNSNFSKPLSGNLTYQEIKDIIECVDVDGLNLKFPSYWDNYKIYKDLLLAMDFDLKDYFKWLIFNFDSEPLKLNEIIKTIHPFINKDNVNTIEGRIGGTLLMSVVEDNDMESVILLLENGADINAINLNNQTVLSYAVSNSNYDMVKLLLSKGAIKDPYSYDIAITQSDRKMINLLD